MNFGDRPLVVKGPGVADRSVQAGRYHAIRDQGIDRAWVDAGLSSRRGFIFTIAAAK